MSVAQPPINSPEIPRLQPVLGPGHTYETVTEQISSAVLTRPTTLGWFAGFTVAFSVLGMLTVAVGWLIIKGTGIWAINIPIGWGFAIVNFVWWIGIGHAGTLISAILYLLNQQFRRSHDALRSSLRRFVSADSHWPPLDGLLHVPVSQHHGGLAAIPEPADLGRVRGFHLRHGFAAVLVRGPYSRFGDIS